MIVTTALKQNDTAKSALKNSLGIPLTLHFTRRKTKKTDWTEKKMQIYMSRLERSVIATKTRLLRQYSNGAYARRKRGRGIRSIFASMSSFSYLYCPKSNARTLYPRKNNVKKEFARNPLLVQ